MTRLLVVDSLENQALIARCIEEGIEILRLPALPVAATDGPVEALGRGGTIVFTDCRTARHCLERLTEEHGDADLLLAATVCALGASTVEALRDYAVHADVVPLGRDVSGLVEALRAYGADLGGPVSLVGGDAEFRRDSLAEFSESQGLEFWPEGASAWDEKPVDSRVAAIVIGGGVDGIGIGSADDLVTLDAAFGPIEGIASDCVIYTDDDLVRRMVAENGTVVRRFDDLRRK